MSHDLVTLGEAMLRLWVPQGERVETAPSYRVTVAGAEANVAMAAARLGLSSAWLSRLPDNPLGRRAAREIAAHGVDVSGVAWDPDGRMGTYFVELSAPPRPISVVYDRAGSAAAAMTPDDVAWGVVEAARCVQISGITPALSTSARETAEAFVTRARRSGVPVVVDVNHRARLWPAAEAGPVVAGLCEGATLVIATAEDCRDLFDITGTPTEAATALAGVVGARWTVVTAGSEGAAWHGPDGAGAAPGHDGAGELDRIGAGDAFCAGAAWGLLSGDVPTGVRRGLAMAALKMGILGDQLVVSPSEIEALLDEGGGREVGR